MPKWPRIAIGLAVLLLPSVGQARQTAIDAAIAAALSETGAKGLAIATIEGGRVRTVKAFGVRNERGDPLTTATIMYAASLTKAVFATYTMMLVDEGRLKLDTPIAAILPKPLPEYGNLRAYGNWGDLAGDERWRRFTARMVLTHSTGFANFAFLEPDRKLRIHFEPGTRYSYSGEGIMLLQFAIEEGLGLKVGEEIDRRIFRPLRMTRTSLQWRPDFASNLADGWQADGTVVAHDKRSRVRAAGSMDTTPADMARFAAALARGWGLSRGARAELTRGSLLLTTRQQFPTLLPDAPLNERPAASAALGMIAFFGPQGAGFYKGGHDDQTANTMVCVARRQRCVVILSNDVRAEAAFPVIVREVLGETGVPYRWEYPGLARY